MTSPTTTTARGPEARAMTSTITTTAAEKHAS
jgi:hypothetical protein